MAKRTKISDDIPDLPERVSVDAEQAEPNVPELTSLSPEQQDNVKGGWTSGPVHVQWKR